MFTKQLPIDKLDLMSNEAKLALITGIVKQQLEAGIHISWVDPIGWLYALPKSKQQEVVDKVIGGAGISQVVRYGHPASDWDLPVVEIGDRSFPINAAIAPQFSNKLFDLTKLVALEHWDLYPHAAWFCPSGWGKDHNTSKLLASAPGQVIACLVKEPELWQKHCPNARIVWNGYDCTEIAQVLQDAVDSNNRRVLGEDEKTPLTIVLSDYPSITDEIPNITEKYIARLLRDGRSNRIRLWFLIQESNVEALKLKGRSQLLRNLTMVRGGEFAREHAAQCVQKKLLPVEVLNDLECDRPCMVGNQVARV